MYILNVLGRLYKLFIISYNTVAHWNPGSRSKQAFSLQREESPDNGMQGTERKLRVERSGDPETKVEGNDS